MLSTIVIFLVFVFVKIRQHPFIKFKHPKHAPEHPFGRNSTESAMRYKTANRSDLQKPQYRGLKWTFPQNQFKNNTQIRRITLNS